MTGHNIEKLVEDTINSLEAATRAEPKPFLLTRVTASINNQLDAGNAWTRMGAFISRPGIAAAGLMMILLLNTTIFLISTGNSDEAVVTTLNLTARDEFATTTIYDIENTEP
ncbi:MAG: hypothetical protein H7258_07590 [Ferruginibacter sp.]|nr:hypothetical protein [Ferruginibacter sp.]